MRKNDTEYSLKTKRYLALLSFKKEVTRHTTIKLQASSNLNPCDWTLFKPTRIVSRIVRTEE